MALITRSTIASMDTSTAQFAPQIPGLVAGEALDIAAPCYIKASDGKVYMTNATAVNEAARVHGFTPRAVGIGQACTLYGVGTRFAYAVAASTPFTIGQPLYAAATKGRLDDGATVGCAFPVAYAVSTTDMVVVWANGQPLTSATIGDASIALTKLVNLATGSIILGVANIPTEVDMKTDTAFPVGNGTTIVPRVMSGDATMANTGAVTLASNKLTGTHVKETAAAEVLGAIPILYRFTIAAGALGNTDITVTNKTRIIDAWTVLKGAGVANTVFTLFNVGNAASGTMAASGADGTITRPATLVTAQCDVADGAILRVTSSVGATQPDAEVYVLGVRVA